LDIDQGHQGLSRTPPMTSIRPAVMEKWCSVKPCVHVDATCVRLGVDAVRAVLDADRYEAVESRVESKVDFGLMMDLS
jgi:hypothetical protein